MPVIPRLAIGLAGVLLAIAVTVVSTHERPSVVLKERSVAVSARRSPRGVPVRPAAPGHVQEGRGDTIACAGYPVDHAYTPVASGTIPTFAPDAGFNAQYGFCMMAQTFVALNWPADVDAGRGVPLDPTDKSIFAHTGSGPRVWQTWKQDWETAGADASVGWNDYTVAAPPCDVLATADGGIHPITPESWPGIFATYETTVLDRVNMVNLEKGTKEEFNPSNFVAGPLVDQSGSFYQFDIRMNAPIFDCVSHGNCVTGDGGLVLPGGNEQTVGAITAKGLWRKPANDSELKSLYSSEVLVVAYEPLADGGILRVCRPETRVLTAMHIVYKDAYMPDCRGAQAVGCDTDNLWVWATFEGNMADGGDPNAVPSCDAVADAGLYNVPTPPLGCGNLPDSGTPTRVCREKAPNPSSQSRNFFKELPPPWNNYLPVALQWRGGFGAPAVNAQLEVFAQQSSCMGCHQPAADSDFVWALRPFAQVFTPQPCSATNAQPAPAPNSK